MLNEKFHYEDAMTLAHEAEVLRGPHPSHSAGGAAPRSGRRLRFVAVLLAATAAIAIASISAHRYTSLERELTESALARRAALAALSAATLSERLDRVVDIGISLASRVQFRELTANGRWDDAAEILRGVPRDFQYISRASLFDSSGTFQSSVPDKLPFEGRSFAHRDWYKGVTADGVPFVSSAYVRDSKPVQAVFGTAVPIKAADGAVLAILHLQSELKPFFNWLGGADFGPHGFAFVVDRAGQLVSHPRLPAYDSIASFAAVPAVREALSGRSGTAVARDEESGEELIYGYAPARHGWGVVTVQPSAQTFAVRDAQLRTTVVDGALIALFALAAIVLGTTVLLQMRREDAERAHREALERARDALAKQAERLRIVHEIDRAIIAEAGPEAIAAAVIQPLREVLGVARAIVNIFDLPAGQVEWLAAAGRHRTHVGPGVRYSMRMMGDAEALKRGETQVVDTSALAPGPEVDELLASGVQVYMVVPMIAGGELIGALSFGGGEKAAFPAEQATIAQEVATQLAIAIAQARLFERVRRDAEALEVANRLLRKSEERLTFALQKCHIGGWDLDLVDQSAHRTLEHDRIFGYRTLLPAWTYEMFLGHVLREDRDEVDRCFREAIAAQSEWSIECRIRRVDGEVRWIHAAGEHQHDEAGQARRMAGIVQDITERKRAEQENRNLNATLEHRVAERTLQLEASNKELESFSYSVSHDLRAPLRAIDGFSRIIEEDYAGGLDAEGLRLLGVIRGNSRKMGQLIDDLLEFSRLGRKSLSSTEVDMNGLVEDVLGELQLSGDSPGAVMLAALPPARGDATLLKQVWTNLLANAIKFSGKRAQPVIEVSGNGGGAEHVYCVKDNGAGFDMKYCDKLFRVFQRLHREDEYEGTGVGLAIVQRVVARHGGRVWAESRVDEGAAFFFALPNGRRDGAV